MWRRPSEAYRSTTVPDSMPPAPDDPLSPRPTPQASPASLPGSPFARRARSRARADVSARLSARTPRIEIVEAPGLRWINIERPRPAEPAWLRGALRLPPARLRGRLLAQPAPEGRRVRRLPVHRAALPALRQAGRAAERRRARHLRRPRLPHHAAQRARCSRSSTSSSAAAPTRSCARASSPRAPGYLLYKIVDDCVDASFPMLRKMGNKLERIEEDIFEDELAEVVRDISNVKQEIINFRKIVRPQRAAFRDLERTKHALHRRRPRHLLRRHQRRVRAHLGHAGELQGGRRGARGHQRVRDLPPPNEIFRILTAFSVVILPLTLIASIWGMNVDVPGEGDSDGVLAVVALHGRHPGGDARLLPPARLAVSRTLEFERLAEAALERSPRARRDAGHRQPVRDDDVGPPEAASSSTRCRAATTSTRSTPSAGPRDRAVPRGGAEGYDVVVAFGGDGTVNEAANGLAGSDTPLTCLPGGATNVYCRMLGIPNDVVDATEHLLRLADDWRAAAGRPRPASTTAASPSPPASGSTPASSSGSTATRACKAPARPVVLRAVGGAHVPAPLRRRPAAARGRGRRANRARRQRLRPERRPTPTSRDARSTSPSDVALDSGDLGGAVLTRASALDVPTVTLRALSKRAQIAAPPPRGAVQRRRRAARPLGRRPAGPGPGRRRLRRRRDRGALHGRAAGARRHQLSTASSPRREPPMWAACP